MSSPLHVTAVHRDRPFAEIGDPGLLVADDRTNLVAVASRHRPMTPTPIAVYDRDDLSCRALTRTRYPVRALAFHPSQPLLAIGAGRYDGGYFFEGRLILLDLETGAARSLHADAYMGRQFLRLDWLDDERLRVTVSPFDDCEDDAHETGHVAVLRRPDWRAVPAGSVTDGELLGPPTIVPEADRGDEARTALTRLSPEWTYRGPILAAERLSDGRILSASEGVLLEALAPDGRTLWSVPDAHGGRDLVVDADERTAWCRVAAPTWRDGRQAIVRIDLADGTVLDDVTTPEPMCLVGLRDGRPTIAPAGMVEERTTLRVRRGSRTYLREQGPRPTSSFDPPETWLAVSDPAASETRPNWSGDVRRLFPYSWRTDEHHFGGRGVELDDGSIIYTGHVWDGRGLRPGGSFVVRRDTADGEAVWDFRTDPIASDLDVDGDVALVAYRDGEAVALDARDGTVLARGPLTIGTVPVFPTTLTVASPGRVLIGTTDGRTLDCTVTVDRPS